MEGSARTGVGAHRVVVGALWFNELGRWCGVSRVQKRPPMGRVGRCPGDCCGPSHRRRCFLVQEFFGKFRMYVMRENSRVEYLSGHDTNLIQIETTDH